MSEMYSVHDGSNSRRTKHTYTVHIAHHAQSLTTQNIKRNSQFIFVVFFSIYVAMLCSSLVLITPLLSPFERKYVCTTFFWSTRYNYVLISLHEVFERLISKFNLKFNSLFSTSITYISNCIWTVVRCLEHLGFV